jgi:hypothetical protein
VSNVDWLRNGSNLVWSKSRIKTGGCRMVMLHTMVGQREVVIRGEMRKTEAYFQDKEMQNL